MSRIDDLIAEHCPAGVKFKELGDVAVIASARVAGDQLDETTYVGVDNLLPNFGGRKDSGYGANSSGAIKFAPNDILIGNIRPYLKKVWLADRNGGASPDVLTISARPQAAGLLMPRFLYYILASDAFIEYSTRHAKGAKMPRGDKVATLRYRIPVPPLAVQREIASILDKMEALKAELEAELEHRSRQYAYYRDSLLTFAEDEGVRWATLSEVLREPLANGRSVPDGSGYPVLRLTALRGPVVDVSHRKLGSWDEQAGSRFRIEAGDLLIVRGNGSKDLIARACMVEETDDVAFPDTMIRVRPDLSQISQRYLFHIWESPGTRIQFQRVAKLTSGVFKVSQQDLSGVVLPVPSLEDQARIVAILDKFDALVNDLSIGLPAEIAARRKQYEHYRDRLLTFQEAR